ncbi:hypothetical protein ACH5RR_007539 [Cinchona calisaya]|uniref:Uncharacterized protein n=1 Tax=Cinchona calisaya TaxID=153742 RepID=A0ABD3ASF9_9GENT
MQPVSSLPETQSVTDEPPVQPQGIQITVARAITSVFAWILLYLMCLLPLGLAYAYHFNLLITPLLVLCAATCIFGPLITALAVRVRDFIHHYLFGLLFPRHLAALFIFAYNRLVVGGDGMVVLYSTVSSGTAFVELALTHFGLAHSGLAHSRLLGACTVLVPYLLSLILLFFGWYEIEGEAFRAYLTWPTAARDFTINIWNVWGHYVRSLIVKRRRTEEGDPERGELMDEDHTPMA